MAPPQHLQIINPSYCRSEDAAFSRFSMLPTELRLRIWICSLERHRLIEVRIDAPEDSAGARPYSTTNALGKLISGRNYTATVQALQLYSKLLRVNRESRSTALGFYRVHIPCHLQAAAERDMLPQMIKPTSTKATLYFNPEYDFIHPTTRGPAEHTVVDFLHDLKANDPRDVGLLNLALDSNGMAAGLYPLSEISEESAKASFVSTLSQLREVIWVAQSHSGRKIMGPVEDFVGVGVRFNHSLPIKPITPSFDLLKHDPRPVGPDLKYVLTGASDPRQMRVHWQELLRRWNIHQTQPTRERVLFAYATPSYEQQVYDTKTAAMFLDKEEKRWLKAQQQRRKLTMKYAGKVPVEGPEELAKAVRPTVGFWLFPAEALGPLEGGAWTMKKVFDMSRHWPELAMSNIS
ncbi:putative 2EXR domain-containing protein [Seiridium cardinale]